MTTKASDRELVGHCYTKARRFPKMVGTFPGMDQQRIPGGPYVLHQLVVMAVVFVVLLLTQGVWARSGWLVDWFLQFAVPYGVGLLVRRVHVDGRSPVAVVGSVLGLLAAPRQGRMAGRAVSSRVLTLTGGGVRCVLRCREHPEQVAWEVVVAAREVDGLVRDHIAPALDARER